MKDKDFRLMPYGGWGGSLQIFRGEETWSELERSLWQQRDGWIKKGEHFGEHEVIGLHLQRLSWKP